MHTYKNIRNLWTTGYYEPRLDGGVLYYKWNPLKDFHSEMEAADYVNYLNGGPAYIDRGRE